jgi:hypothetical protein
MTRRVRFANTGRKLTWLFTIVFDTVGGRFGFGASSGFRPYLSYARRAARSHICTQRCARLAAAVEIKMVDRTLITASNAQINEPSAPPVALFVGGTSGIGKLTLGAIAKLGTNFKAYVVGRKESRAAFETFAESLRLANSNVDIVWVEGQVSLLSEVKRICDHIKTLESSIDLLFMTTGYVPLGGRQSRPSLPIDPPTSQTNTSRYDRGPRN